MRLSRSLSAKADRVPVRSAVCALFAQVNSGEPLPGPWRQGRSDLADAYMRIGHRWRMWLSPECRVQRLRKEGIGKSTKPRTGADEQQRTCTPRDTGRYFALHS